MTDKQLNKLGFVLLGGCKLCSVSALLLMFAGLHIISAILLLFAFILISATVLTSWLALKQQRGEWKEDTNDYSRVD